jgi:replication factor C small subunit
MEKLEITEDGYDALVYIAAGDLRRATNALQVSAALSKQIDGEILYRATATARPEDVEELLNIALSGEFLKARDILDKLLITYGLSGEDIVRQIHRAVFDLSIPDKAKVELVDRIGEIEFRLVEGSNERIQLEALLAHFVCVGGSLARG